MTTTAWDDYGLPEDGALDVKPITEDRKAEAIAIFAQALDNTDAFTENRAIWMGRMYDRKGWMTIDALGDERNRSYAAVNDDYVIQVAVRVTYEEAREIGLQNFEEVLVEDKKAAARKALENEITTAEAAAQAAVERIAEARARLQKM